MATQAEGAPIMFGKYELLSQIAAGGMAELFLARARSLKGFEKYCVIKRILPHKTRDPMFVEMFLDEAKLAATLDHPNVVQVYDVGAVEGEYFIAMEYLHGEDLLELVRRGIEQGIKKPPLDVVVSVLAGALAGLHYAHERRGFDGKPLNIVHRDVTPGNIVITYEGAVKLVDFGIAKAATREVHQDTRAGALKGKIQYMSPEQCRGDELDRRSDLFAVGILLYELTVGRRLFHEKSDFETLKKIVEGPVPDPRDVDPQYPEALRTIVMRALGKRPEDRYPTAREMLAAVEGYAREEKLVTGTVALAQYMERVFAEKIASWRKAEADGQSLADRVAFGRGDGSYVGERRRRTPSAVYAVARRKRQQRIILQVGVLVALAGSGAAVVWRLAQKTPVAPPVVTTKVVEKPVVVEKPIVVEKPVDKPVPVEKPADKPVVKEKPRHHEPAGRATVTLAANPWCEVLIDGKPFGQTPLVDVSLPSGTHTVTFLNSAANVHEDVKLKLAPGQVLRKKFDFHH